MKSSTGSSASRVTRVLTLDAPPAHGSDQWESSQWSKWVSAVGLMATTSKRVRLKGKTSSGHTYSHTIYLAQEASAWRGRQWVGQVTVGARPARIYTLAIGPSGGSVVDHFTGGAALFPRLTSR